MCVEEAAVIVTVEKDIKTTCTITLTSPIMREEGAAEGGMREQSSVTLWGMLISSCPGLTSNFLSEEHFHQKILMGVFNGLILFSLATLPEYNVVLMCVKCYRYMQYTV